MPVVPEEIRTEAGPRAPGPVVEAQQPPPTPAAASRSASVPPAPPASREEGSGGTPIVPENVAPVEAAPEAVNTPTGADAADDGGHERRSVSPTYRLVDTGLALSQGVATCEAACLVPVHQLTVPAIEYVEEQIAEIRKTAASHGGYIHKIRTFFIMS
jgi:hypothetical protein